jgi:hypothetical protein
MYYFLATLQLLRMLANPSPKPNLKTLLANPNFNLTPSLVTSAD